MPISFPDSPSVNDTYTVNGRNFIWNGAKWQRLKPRVTSALPTIDVSNDFSAGDTLHVDSETGRVGIGTSSPAVDLHVDGDVEFTGTLDVSGLITSATASAITNDTTVATTAYVTTAVSNLIGGAPAALDTLNELAAALDDDASYAATITTALAGKIGTTATFGGDVSGTYDNIVISDDSHNHIIGNVDGLQTALDGKLSTTGTAADSSKLGGLSLSAGSSAPSGSQVIRSHTNGYTYLGWINTVSGATTSTISRIYASNDAFVRYVTPATFRSQIINGQAISPSSVTASGDINAAGNLYVGQNNGGDSNIFFYDDNTNTRRTFQWDDSANDWRVEDNSGTMRVLYHSGNIPSYLSTSGGTISGSINVTSVCQSNEFQGDVGSSSDVTYMFDGDTDTGMYRYGSGEAALSGNGTWRTRTVGTGLSVNYYVNMSAGTYNHAVCGGAANAIAFRWASPYLKASIDNVICAIAADFSDERIKTNIRDWAGGIDLIRQLRPVEYTPRDVIGFGELSGNIIEGYEAKSDLIGLIAQEVRDVIPSAVTGDPEGSELLSIAKDQLMAVIISAIQDIDSRLREMESA